MNEPVCVVAAVFHRDGLVLACRRSPDRSAGGHWEFPGGKVESEESPQLALRREILEELSVSIMVGPLLDTSTTIVDGLPIELSCFLIEEFDPVPEHSTDHDQLRWCRPADLPAMDFAEPDLPAVRLLAEMFPPDLLTRDDTQLPEQTEPVHDGPTGHHAPGAPTRRRRRIGDE